MSVAVRFAGVVPPPPREGWPGPISLEIEEGTCTLFATTPAIALNLIRLIVGLREPGTMAGEMWAALEGMPAKAEVSTVVWQKRQSMPSPA